MLVFPLESTLLCLLLLANGVPIMLAAVLRHRLAWPVDCGYCLASDGQPLFGPSKTWRGVVLSVALTGWAAWIMGLPSALGHLIAATAMLGDLLSSWLKRRAGLSAGSMVPGLDQVPESLLPLVVASSYVPLSAGTVIAMVVVFSGLDFLISRLLFVLRLRERPW